jgi:NAD(P)-dependent dehydrogenase (short-subunit alcohol dehydrogenase family)
MNSLAKKNILVGKIALVTGSVGGIGHATARALADKGCALMIHGLTEIRDGDAISLKIAEEFNVKTAFSNADLSSLSGIENLIRETEKKLAAEEIELKKQLEILDTYSQDTKAFYNRAKPLYENFINQAKDLGIDYPKNVDTNFKILEKQVEFITTSVPKINK